MVSFECTFEVRTRNDAVWVLQEMISQIEGDNYCGYGVSPIIKKRR